MVKQINLFLDDKDHKKVMEAKGDMTWKEFFLLFSEMVIEKRVEEKKQDKRKRNDEKSK